MTPDQFTYWLQGFVETNGGKAPTKQQWQIIKDHLKLCFNKVTPQYPSLEHYRQFNPTNPVDIGTAPVNPIQPPFKVTCTSGDYGNPMGRTGGYVFNPDGFYQGSGGGGSAPKGGGGAC
jgi:hypothetical protein